MVEQQKELLTVNWLTWGSTSEPTFASLCHFGLYHRITTQL